jgi:hypothetical protein
MMAAVDERPDADVGRAIIQLSWSGTVIFGVSAIAAAAAPGALGGLAVVVDLICFAVGMIAFLSAYAIAVQRSRYEAVNVGGLFLLIGSAPRHIQWRLWGSLLTQIAVALATASIRPFSRLAFGVLVPMLGLALCGQWGARHGHFAPRPPSSRRPDRLTRQTRAEAGQESQATTDPVDQNARHG